MTLDSDLAALEKGICQPDEEAACLEDNTDPEWACQNCPKKKSSDLSPYTHKLIRLYNLQKAGYPFQGNDIEYDEWLDLGRVRMMFESKKTGCPMMTQQQ